jgi:hypothetical protein
MYSAGLSTIEWHAMKVLTLTMYHAQEETGKTINRMVIDTLTRSRDTWLFSILNASCKIHRRGCTNTIERVALQNL